MHPNKGSSSHGSFAHPARNVAALAIDSGMKVADFGAGSGAYVFALSKAIGERGTVYAIDIQKDLLRRIKNEAHKHGATNVEVLWGDLEEEHGSKLKNDLVEVVLVSNLLFQIKNKNNVIKEAVRILRPSGRLAIIDWTDSFGGMGPYRDDVVTKQEAYDLARDAHLTFVEEFDAGAHHYGLIFRKTHPTPRKG